MFTSPKPSRVGGRSMLSLGNDSSDEGDVEATTPLKGAPERGSGLASLRGALRAGAGGNVNSTFPDPGAAAAPVPSLARRREPLTFSTKGKSSAPLAPLGGGGGAGPSASGRAPLNPLNGIGGSGSSSNLNNMNTMNNPGNNPAGSTLQNHPPTTANLPPALVIPPTGAAGPASATTMDSGLRPPITVVQEDDLPAAGPSRIQGHAGPTRFENEGALAAAVAGSAAGNAAGQANDEHVHAADGEAAGKSGLPTGLGVASAALLARRALMGTSRHEWKVIPQGELEDPLELARAEVDTYFRATSAPVLAALGQSDDARVLAQMLEVEDEGIYVGVKPLASRANYCRLEQRLLLEKTEGKRGTRWFGRDGAVGNLPDPLSGNLMRPSQWFDPDAAYLETVPVKPQRVISVGSRAVTGDELRYRLDVDVRDITFYDHPLFSKEDFLAARLSQLSYKYLGRKELALPGFYTDRLAAMIKARDHLVNVLALVGSAGALNPTASTANLMPTASSASLFGLQGLGAAGNTASTLSLPFLDTLDSSFNSDMLNSSQNFGGPGGMLGASPRASSSSAALPMVGKDSLSASAARKQNFAAQRVAQIADAHKKIASMRKEIAQLRRLRDAEELADRHLVHEMIETWNRLKKVRADKGFSCTSARLVIRVTKEPAEQVEARYQREIEEELREQLDEHVAAHEARMHTYHQQMAEYRRARARLDEERRLEEELERTRALAKAASVDSRVDSQALESVASAATRALSLSASAERSAQRLAELAAEEARLVLPEVPELTDFDTEGARALLEERYARSKRRPGEDILDPVLLDSNPVSPDDSCPRAERARRDAVSRLRFHARVLVNGKQVTRSKSAGVGEDWRCRIGEIYSLQLAMWPDSLCLEVVEEGGLVSAGTVLATVFLRIPGEGDSFATDPSPDRFLFASDQHFLPQWEELAAPPNPGSVSPRTEGTQEHFLHGAAEVASAWKPVERVEPAAGGKDGAAGKGERAQRAALCPPHRSRPPPPPEQMSKLGHASRKTLALWTRGADLDPNDPRNAALMRVLRDMRETQGLDQRFRITEDEKGLLFAFTSGPEPRRFAILRARADGEVDEWQVPLFDHLIDERVFRSKEGAAAARRRTGTIDPLAAERESKAIPEFVKQLRERAAARGRGERRYDVNDVINEEPVPLRDFSLGNIGAFFRPRRPLNPNRAERKPVSKFVEQCTLLVQITRGYNVPVRATSIADSTLPPYPGTEAEVQPNGVTIRPFLEVTFLNHTARTMAADDTDPQWNELISVPFVPPGNDFSPSALSHFRSNITFSLYDELTIDNPKDDRTKDAIDQRKERRWLGSFDVPFKYVYENVKVEGIFELKKPPVSLGYSPLPQKKNLGLPAPAAQGLAAFSSSRGGVQGAGAFTSSRFGALGGGGGGGGGVGIGVGVGAGGGAAAPDGEEVGKVNTMIGLFMTFDPLLARPEEGAFMEISTDNYKFNEYAYRWIQGLRGSSTTKARNIICTATNIYGENVLITRYVHPQPPPPELGNQVLKLVRFVSLIPFEEDADTFGVKDGSVWATSKEFLEMNSGDEEEHAILLCNYLLYLKFEAYVVLGMGFPEGETSYVLTRDPNGGVLLWNPSTGDRYDTSDNQGALKSIGCVFNAANIWANIQPFDSPSRMSFNFHDEKCWKPFFTDANAVPQNNPEFATVQTDTLSYTVTPGNKALDLEARLDAAIGSAVEAARVRFPTQWNLACSRTLKTLLKNFELDKLGDVPFSLKKHNESLGNFWLINHMHGQPLNTSYTSVQNVIDMVLKTGTHLSEDPHVQFAKAVYVAPYANNVLSVWVYLVAIRPFD